MILQKNIYIFNRLFIRRSVFFQCENEQLSFVQLCVNQCSFVDFNTNIRNFNYVDVRFSFSNEHLDNKQCLSHPIHFEIFI